MRCGFRFGEVLKELSAVGAFGMKEEDGSVFHHVIAALRETQVLDDLTWAADQCHMPIGGLLVDGLPENATEGVAHDGTSVGIHDARLERLSVCA